MAKVTWKDKRNFIDDDTIPREEKITAEDMNELKGVINSMEGGGGGIAGDTIPIGAMIPINTSIVPDGWLLCDGSLISRTEYSELFAIIGESYGAGDGETTFALPNEPNPLAYTREGVEVQLIDRVPSLFMIIKAKQIIPITGGIVNDQTSKSETDALSADATRRLLEKHTTDLPEVIFGTTKMEKDNTYTLTKSYKKFRYLFFMYSPLESLNVVNTMIFPVRFVKEGVRNQFAFTVNISNTSTARAQIGLMSETTFGVQAVSGEGTYPDMYVRICGIR